MTNLHEDEMAAIAAGLWKGPIENPANHSRCSLCASGYMESHGAISRAPNMRDPANLWRALENVVLIERVDAEGYICDQKLHQPELWFQEPFWYCRIDSWMESQRSPKIIDAVFAALVALYKAEHPQE